MSNLRGTAEETDDLARLLDAAVIRLHAWRCTFTEEEALSSVWKAGFEVSPASDPRFVLARESDGIHPRQWRLTEHVLANDRLLGTLRTGQWDGRDLDVELARLDTADHVRYVFCPLDPRFTMCADGSLEPADREPAIDLPASVSAALNALGPAVLQRWRQAGAPPWTLRQVTETLGDLGWSGVGERENWVLVRAWLLGWPQVVRVGVDYWILVDHVPKKPERTRLRVLPVLTAPDYPEAPIIECDPVMSGPWEEYTLLRSAVTSPLPPGALEPRGVRWTVPLRTVHVLEGFVPVPPAACSAYPPPQVGEGDMMVLPGRWFDTGGHLWLWLDRAQNRLFGPALADQLAWCEAGDLLRVEWIPEVIVLRLIGHDTEVQHEETRLVDVQALAELRGGLGESYRRSLQVILAGMPDGLTFKDVVAVLRERQGHAVHRGTVRALLTAGSFVQHDGRWYAAPIDDAAARRFRAATVAALVPEEQNATLLQPATAPRNTRAIARAIQTRLSTLIRALREMS